MRQIPTAGVWEGRVGCRHPGERQVARAATADARTTTESILHVGSTLARAVRWLVAVVLLASSASPAASPAAEAAPSEPCGLHPSTSSTPALPRLAELRYRCLVLANGQQVLVGQAGPAAARKVLLVHGLGGGAHRDWVRVIPALAPRFHVLAVDLPGFGDSTATPQGYSFDAIAATLDAVLERVAPGERTHLVGHSLGAAVALHFAHRHPSRVDHLVLVGAAGILLKTVFAQHSATLRMPQVGFAPVDRYFRDLDEQIARYRQGVFDRVDDGFDFSRWLARFPAVRHALLGRHTRLEAALGLVEHDFTSAIRETAAPTTVIWGANDTVAPPRTGRLLAARMPDARLDVINGAAHAPMLETPTPFNRLLLAGLSSPLRPRQAEPADGPSQGDAACAGRQGAQYRGVYDSITLDQCPGARIEDARIRQLTVRESSLTLENSVVDGGDVALWVQQSEVVATAVTLRGRVAIRAERSRLDLAGVSLQATERGVEMPTPSRFQFSVSDWHGTDYRGNAHFLWPAASPTR